MYVFKKIDDESYSDIKLLYHSCFALNEHLSVIKKKYSTDFVGIKNVGYFAKDENGNSVSYYGVFPAILRYESDDYLVAQSGDTMTSPLHQKKGLFTSLAKQTYQLSLQNGIKFVFGFPNINSYPGFKNKLDWVFFGNMQKFTINVFTLPICELSSKWKFLNPLYHLFVESKLKKYKIEPRNIDFSLFNYSEVKGFIKKDIHFLNYKLANKNNFFVEINGFKILLKVDIHLIIGEIEKIALLDSNRFLKTIKKLAQILACKKIIFNLSCNHWLYDILNNSLTPSESLPIGFYNIDSTFEFSEIQFSGADYDTF